MDNIEIKKDPLDTESQAELPMTFEENASVLTKGLFGKGTEHWTKKWGL